MARLGIVGFANTGKTTLFNALTGLGAYTAPHPFATTEPNVGVAKIPDSKLEAVARVEGSAKVVPATLDLLDLPALGHPGESASGGLGGQFVGRLREMDALVAVLRVFSDPSIPSDESGTDPVAQAEEIMLELALVDHEALSRRSDRVSKEASADPSKRSTAAALNEAVAILATGASLRTRPWPEQAQAAYRDSGPLSLKPVMWVLNVDEEADSTEDLIEKVKASVPPGDPVVAVSARLEQEGARLSPEDRIELFEGLGLGEGALALLFGAAYEGLGLISFYTVGPKESRAWTIPSGATAPEAAGKIHSDLERGFIRAEVSTVDQVIEAGGWDHAKRAGKVRVEGRSYVVAPGDVLMIRFSV
ncbi:MAG: DUF933 domain-containing protein [Acidimicrobiia bacterium]